MELTPERLSVMLSMQDEMNKKVNPDWLDARYPWLRAVVVEGAEALDHYGWKWWKKQAQDIEQFKIELVDIWHFYLSHYVQRCEGHLLSAQRVILGMLGAEYFRSGLSHGNTFYIFTEMDTLQKLELLISMAASRHANPIVLHSIMQDVGMSWGEMYRSYVGKNVLNFFRQDHGYKEGTYRKVWGDEEDNVHLARIMETIDDPILIYKSLEEIYAR